MSHFIGTKEGGALSKMIDFHNHILPNIDDGSKSQWRCHYPYDEMHLNKGLLMSLIQSITSIQK